MLHTLIDIGPISIHSYGLMMALAFLAGIIYVSHRSTAEGFSPDNMMTIAYIVVIGGLIGGRLGFVLMHWADFSGDLWGIINPFQGDHFGLAGMNLYGGVLLAVGSLLFYLTWKELPLLPVCDLFAPSLGLGIAIGRIGCLLNGCCFGVPTDLPWGVTFPEDSLPALIYGTVPLHPTQLYSAGYGLILFIGLHYLLRHKRFDGQVLAVLFIIESVFRIAIEQVRFYEPEMLLNFGRATFTYNHLIAAALFVGGMILYIMVPRNLYRTTLEPAETE